MLFKVADSFKYQKNHCAFSFCDWRGLRPFYKKVAETLTFHYGKTFSMFYNMFNIHTICLCILMLYNLFSSTKMTWLKWAHCYARRRLSEVQETDISNQMCFVFLYLITQIFRNFVQELDVWREPSNIALFKGWTHLPQNAPLWIPSRKWSHLHDVSNILA